LVLTNRVIFRKAHLEGYGYLLTESGCGFRRQGFNAWSGRDLLVRSGGGDSTTALRNVPVRRDETARKRRREAMIKFNQAGQDDGDFTILD
jgi:hypothetical protein